MLQLPSTRKQFFDLLSAYNEARERSYIDLLIGFMAADAVWSHLTHLAGIVGFWRLRRIRQPCALFPTVAVGDVLAGL